MIKNLLDLIDLFNSQKLGGRTKIKVKVNNKVFVLDSSNYEIETDNKERAIVFDVAQSGESNEFNTKHVAHDPSKDTVSETAKKA